MSGQAMEMTEETPVPVRMGSTRIGLREYMLFAIGVGYAALMFDQGKIALIAGWVAVGLWLYGLVRGPRLSATQTAVCGAGVFLMTFWWPEENWWQLAIPLMWAGIVLVAIALVMKVLSMLGERQHG